MFTCDKFLGGIESVLLKSKIVRKRCSMKRGEIFHYDKKN